MLRIATEFLVSRKLFRSLVSQQFPFLFVDESQDTSEAVVAALKAVAAQASGKACLGFFGDPMQKIYLTGVGVIPANDQWVTIEKPENFRCPTEVMAVANAIRRDGDGLVQTRGRTTLTSAGEVVSESGTARLFIMPADDRRDLHVAEVRAQICRPKQ